MKSTCKKAEFVRSVPSFKSLGLIATLLLSTIVSQLFAYELDWTEVDWLEGDEAVQQQTFYNVDGSTIDTSISLVISGSDSFGSNTTISNRNLRLGANYRDVNRSLNYIDVEIIFSSAVTNVSLSLNDIDKGGSGTRGYWEDIIENIRASNENTPVEIREANPGSQLIIDMESDAGDVLYRGSRSDQFTDQSRLYLAWEDPLDRLSFRYSGGENTYSNPSYQVVGMSGIKFEYSPVPEPGTMLAGGMGLLVILYSFIRTKLKNRNSISS
ncbi:MAG: PEP-CTERM sorting domain-containing protein [Opitutales bacterium]|nr:PEP-CTERM sorting domain-containing protein [Opitutales bacterium]